MGDFFSGALNILAQAAPTVASLFGGPLAGQAVSFVEQQLGVTPQPGASMEDRAKSLVPAIESMTPDQLLDLRKADDAFKQKLVDSGIALEQVDEQDRASARAREAAVKDWTPRLLAMVVTLGFFGLLTLMAFHDFPAGGRDLLQAMIGSLGTAWVTIVSYYFGSSAGHAQATALLAQMGTNAGPPK